MPYACLFRGKQRNPLKPTQLDVDLSRQRAARFERIRQMIATTKAARTTGRKPNHKYRTPVSRLSHGYL